jgi:hypothetical protein
MWICYIYRGQKTADVLIGARHLFYILAIAVDQQITQAAIHRRKQENTGNGKHWRWTLKTMLMHFKLLTDFINGFIEKSGVGAENILGAGIGMPGFVDANKGVNYS